MWVIFRRWGNHHRALGAVMRTYDSPYEVWAVVWDVVRDVEVDVPWKRIESVFSTRLDAELRLMAWRNSRRAKSE
jgi:hypothetical protein